MRRRRRLACEGDPAFRYGSRPERRFGTAALRRAIRLALGRTFGDATSGLYAVNALALPLLAETYTSRAPEVEALVRIANAGLHLEEIPVTMEARASGESKLRGSKAVQLVVTVAGTLLAAKFVKSRRAR